MPIDARIALGAQAPQVQLPDFQNLALQSAQMQNYFSAIATRNRALTEQNNLQAVVARPDFNVDDPEHQQQLRSAAPNLSQAYLKSVYDSREAQAKAEREAIAAHNAKLVQSFQHTATLNTREAAIQSINKAEADGKMPPDIAEAQRQAVPMSDADMPAYQTKLNAMIAEHVTPGTQMKDQTTQLGQQMTYDASVGNNKRTIAGENQRAANTIAFQEREGRALPADGNGVINVINSKGEVINTVNTAPKAGAGKSPVDRKEAADRVTIGLDKLTEHYKELDKNGALIRSGDTNPWTKEKDAGPNRFNNLMTAASTTGFGQMALGAIGTKPAAERQGIETIRFNMVNALNAMQGVGSKQMDSITELQNALKSLGGPGMTREAVAGQLETLGEMFLKVKRDVAARDAEDGAATGSGAPADIEALLNKHAPVKR
jgi:hypothetical protein